MEYNGGYIGINPKYNKLITSLRTAVENGEGMLDKEATSHEDLLDSFRLPNVLALNYFLAMQNNSPYKKKDTSRK